MARRKPFDPSRVKVPRAERSPDAAAPLAPHQVNELIQGAIARHLPSTLQVLGEIGDLSRPASGHLYFTLKDDVSELRAVMWRSAAQRLKFTPEPGLEVIATGTIEVYNPRGTYQLMVRKLEPRGQGALELAFRQLQKRLADAGLFDTERKQPLPPYPQRVAIVTSLSGAAIRDIVQTLRRRAPYVELFVMPVPVQGDAAAPAIAAAIAAINTHADSLGGVDALIVGRGGGSLEDLWAFNEEVVARAIAASGLPVISAVGHEVDITIADLVADVRAATPTAAAELVAPSTPDLIARLRDRLQRATNALAQDLTQSKHALDQLVHGEALARPERRLRELTQRVDERLLTLRHLQAERHNRTRHRVQATELRLARLAAGRRFGQLGLRLERRLQALHAAIEQTLWRRERTWSAQVRRLATAGPQQRLAPAARALQSSRQRLDAAAGRLLAYRRRLFEARLEALRACDPRSVLRRGYSITRAAKTRRILGSVRDVRDQQRIITELADGEFRATADDPRQPQLFDEDGQT